MIVFTRRELFQVAAAGAGARAAHAAAGPAITRIEVFPVAYPVTAHFKFFTRPERPAVFVKITCETGAVGWGQSVPIPTWSYETVESVVATLENYVAPALIGRDALDIAGAHAAMNRAIAPSFSTGDADRQGRRSTSRCTTSWESSRTRACRNCGGASRSRAWC